MPQPNPPRLATGTVQGNRERCHDTDNACGDPPVCILRPSSTARLQGNRERYYDPENSLLDAVLSSREGIPISIGVLHAAVSPRRLSPC